MNECRFCGSTLNVVGDECQSCRDEAAGWPCGGGLPHSLPPQSDSAPDVPPQDFEWA